MGLLDELDAPETRLSLSFTSGPRDHDDNENIPPQPGQGQNYGGTPRGHERSIILAPSSSFNGTPSTPGSQGFIFLSSRSVLGRRERVESLTDWSPPTKAHLKEYTEDVAGEYEIPVSRWEDLVKQARFVESLHSSSLIRAVFLDANLSSYKTGLLNRLLRHLRLNPGVYRIPQEFRIEITGTAFNSALALVDYTESGAPVDLFWDDIDIKLAKHHEKTAEIPKFEEALKLHLRLCQPKAKKKSRQCLTSWQIELSKAVEEMDGYTQEDLAEEENELTELDSDSVSAV
ncbi:hypothetical protein DFH08DRAFT_817623 [Mycena albidolilacea]|uniref:Uncharacterized protein n=1 Tax=Mycena albidolilacea TaxID=1033008 RepID=A0AAD6ZHW3_9AGAR|nr:hypothetical protein DFH08DRAFT_817623 [Mycena albidolilacea]